MPPAPLIDPVAMEQAPLVADREAIMAINPQRGPMQQLDAIVHLDQSDHLIVGYKDVRDDEFWVEGHMPGYPLMPGVLMCEAAAQLISYHCHLLNLADGGFLGFGGMEDVKFRGQVRPGDRLVIVAKGTKINRRQTVFSTQGFVGGDMVFQANIIGVPIRRAVEAEALTA